MRPTPKRVAVFCVVAIAIAIPVSFFALIEIAWFGPARIYADAQMRSDVIFADQNWEGHATWFHYDRRVRLTSPSLTDDNVRMLYPILHDIEDLRYIELYATSMTDEGVAGMKREFPNCHLTVYDQWF